MNTHFLAVQIRTVIDTPENPGDPGDPTATPPVPPTPPTPAVTHEEVDNTFLETDVATIIRNLENPPENRIEYYEVQFNGPTFQATLHPVNLKAGPRTTAPAREIAEIEAAGQVVGSTTVVA